MLDSSDPTATPSPRRAGRVVALLLALLVSTISLSLTQPAQATDPTLPGTSARVSLDKVILKQGDRTALVRHLKARLVQLKLLSLPFNGKYGAGVTRAVKTFQKRRGIKATGQVDVRTWRKLAKRTKFPTKQQLSGHLPPPPRVPGLYTQRLGRLDGRCLTGAALCIDKSTRTMQWVVDGRARWAADVRFGASGTPTREGLFTVYHKSRNHVSSIYGSSMPFAMFFDGGQAVHYSPDFASHGYSGASHGCVNVRDYRGIAALFDNVAVGTKVVVYWS